MSAESSVTLYSSGSGGATAVHGAASCASPALGGYWPGQPLTLTTLPPAVVLGEFLVLSLSTLRAMCFLGHGALVIL